MNVQRNIQCGTASRFPGISPVLVSFVGFALCAAPGAPAQAPFHPNPHLYSETANPNAQIATAEAQAKREGKHILLEFGGNWCGDCQVLDYLYHQPPNASLIERGYIVVHIDIGHIDKNLDVAARYGVPVAHGVPSLALLDARGKVLYAEQPKEFERPSPEALHALLERWQPAGGR